jgi:hypothetical protein
MSEVCGKCPNDCVRTTPVTINGKVIFSVNDIIKCVNWTCAWGITEAKRALERDEAKSITLYDGSVVMGTRFGTEDHKPTAQPGEFERLVTSDGQIIAKNENGEYFFTGQNIYRRRI